MKNREARLLGFAAICFSVACAGCGEKSESSSSSRSGSSGSSSGKSGLISGFADDKSGSSSNSGQKGLSERGQENEPARRPIGVAHSSQNKTSLTNETPTDGGNAGSRNATEALRSLQVVIGSWHGVTTRSIAGAKGVEDPQWEWDFSEKSRPALVLVSKTSSFLRKARLTYLEDAKEYELTAVVDRKGSEKTYRGNFTEPVRDESQEGKKDLQRTFKLSLTQVKPLPGNREPLYKIEFQQRNNNRYWLIVHRKAGKTLHRTDTVGNQRQGTQFAAAPDDYGDKTCVVSQGLGTIPVSDGGRTYYVCCSGCKAAFEKEPKKWIASFLEWKKTKNRK